MTLTGYTAAQTRHEVIKMLHGARSKWGIQNPNTLLDEIPPPSVQSLVLKEWNGNKYAGAAPGQKWLVEGAIPDIIRTYIAEEDVTYYMILGINNDGVICSPIKDWTPEHPEAFSSLEVVSWTLIQKYKKG